MRFDFIQVYNNADNGLRLTRKPNGFVGVQALVRSLNILFYFSFFLRNQLCMKGRSNGQVRDITAQARSNQIFGPTFFTSPTIVSSTI